MSILLRYAKHQLQSQKKFLRADSVFFPSRRLFHSIISSNESCNSRISMQFAHISLARDFHSSSPMHKKQQKGDHNKKTNVVMKSVNNDKQDLINDIKAMMSDAKTNRRYDIMLLTYKRSVYNNIELSNDEYMNILRVYTMRMKSTDFDFDQVMFIYEKLKAKKMLNFQVLSYMLIISQHENNHRLAMEVNRDFENCFRHNETTLKLVIAALTNTNAVNHTMKFYKLYRSFLPDNTELNAILLAESIKKEQALKERIAQCDTDTDIPIDSIVKYTPLQSNWKPLDAVTHLNVVKMLSQQGHRLQAAEVLIDFADHNDKYQTSQQEKELSGKDNRNISVDSESLPAPSYITTTLLLKSPSPVSSELVQILEEGLVQYDAAIVTIILRWFVEAYEYHHSCVESGRQTSDSVTSVTGQFPRGLLHRCLRVGGALGNRDITDLTKELYSLTDISMERDEFCQVFISQCRARDVQGTIETMVVAEATEIDFFSGSGDQSERQVSSGGSSSDGIRVTHSSSDISLLTPRYLQNSIAKMIPRLHDLDRLYFSLAELVQADMRPPIAALNALIIGQGGLQFLDRAFAVMQEFESVFDTKPNADTYYALLGAIARSRAPRVENMLHVMSDMDDAGFTPDSGCFSLLLETMIKVNDADGATGILEHLRASATSTTTAIMEGSDEENKECAEESDSISTVLDVSLLPSLRTLRLLALFYTKKGNKEQCEIVLDLLRAKQGSKIFPLFFTQRLTQLQQQQEQGGSGQDESSQH